MKIKKVNLDTVIGITSEIPEMEFPEIAFAGKSNVGKSSIINALMNRKSYARTSEKPGKTQTINYYNVNDAIYLVDLPGYGYANVSVMYDWVLSVGFRPVIIATKADKLKKNERVKNVNIIRKELGMKAEDKLILTSSLKKEAIDQVWKSLCDDAGIENIE